MGQASSLGDQLRSIRFDEAHVRLRLGGARLSQPRPDMVAVVRRRVGAADALSRSMAFWHLGIDATVQEAEALLDPLSVDELAAVGLVVGSGDVVSPAVRISPYDDLLIAHDFDDGGSLGEDFVLGIGAATRTLASLTPRRQVGRTLDLGTGSGAQALLATRHSDSVVATDLSERAIWMARLSAALSGKGHLDLRIGDGLRPVTGETFDLIVANPPFVISPDHELVFRDTAANGDDTSRSVVQEVAPSLNADGIACVLVNWIITDGSGETDAPRAWVADLGCDALILHHDTRDPLGYAERWAMLPASSDASTRGALFDRWLGYFSDLGATSIASGAIILRKRGGPGRVRVEKMPKRPRDGGDQVMRMLDSFGRFKGPDDPALPGTVFRLVHGHRLEQHLNYGHGQYRPGDAVLRLDHSAGVLAKVPADLLEALFAIDGKRSAGAIASDIAEVRGAPADALRARLLPVLLRLYELGFLESPRN